MATEFVSTMTERVGFVRFAGRTPEGKGPCFEFGTVSNFHDVVAEMEMGARFEPFGGTEMDGDVVDAFTARQAMVDGRATFGRFAFTVEVGSGDATRFAEER